MWKKIWMTCIGLIGACSAMLGYYNYTMDAAPANLMYYKVGEKFERTNKDTFTMGGIDWRLVYVNNDTGWILSNDNVIQYANCSDLASQGPWVFERSYGLCMNTINSYYNANATKIDEMGKVVNGSNQIGTFKSPSLSQYLTITNNESNMGKLSHFHEFFLDDTYSIPATSNSARLVYSSTVTETAYVKKATINGTLRNNLMYNVNSNYPGCIHPIIEIKLPQKGIIKTITADQSAFTHVYSDPMNQANQNLVAINTTEGEGPYHFYVFDTDVNGNGTYSTPSSYFQLSADTANGTAQISLINQLAAGDYYFKVKVVDESKNERLYYDPNDFTSDPFRSKETDVIHVKINKATPTIAFDDPNITNKSIADAQNGWSETATAVPSSDIKVTYAKVGGDVSLINIDPDTGAITFTGNANAFGKVTIQAVADDDPAGGNDNYNATAPVTKDIVIYRDVSGSITPDANSSDPNQPTFTASDPNVKINGVIGTIIGAQGTPDNVTSGATTYTYGIKSSGDGSLFSVNPSSGIITSKGNLGVGSYQITVTVSDKWSSHDIPVTVNVGVASAEDLKFYDSSTSNTVINTKSVNFTDTNVSVFATVKGSTNTNPVTYSLKAGEPTNVIDVHPNSGVVTIKGIGTVVIAATKQGASGQADAYAELTFTVSAGAQDFIYTTDSTLSTERAKTNGRYDTLTETFASSKTFQLYTTGNPPGSTVTYALKDGSPTDVISVDPSGTIHILNASLNTQIGRVIVEATSHDPSGNYSDKTIELPIDIEKGTRTVSFSDHPINVVSGKGSVTPTVEIDGVLDTSGTALIEIDPSEDNSIAWTNDGITIQYNWNDQQSKDIKIKVTKPADRNYKAADGVGILHILGADENVLTLSTPGKITYGDHFIIRSTQDDSMSTNVQYSFTTDNGVYISAPQVNGKQGEFDALAYSGSTEIAITVTRTADGELPLTKTVKIKVLPKPISIQIENKDKLRLEDNPPLTYSDFSNELVTWNGMSDQIDTSIITLTTTAVKYSPIGSYPITAGKAQAQLNKNYPNYIFTIQDGLLNVKDNGNKDFWDIDDDGCPDLNIRFEDEEGNNILLNGDLNDDGIPDYNIDSNGDGKPDLNIDTDNDGKPDLNLVILKEWKPTKCVTLEDIQFSSGISAKAEINVDVDNDGVPDIDIDTDGDMKANINIDSDRDGKANVNLHTIEVWKPNKDYRYETFTYDTMNDLAPYLNVDTDGDGRPDVNIDLDNDGVADINIDTDGDLIPDIDIDSSGDGLPDINIDTDGDGKADENLKDITVWKPEHNVDDPFMYDTMRFDEVTEPDDKKEDQPNKEVQGNYYPGGNTGGALTGDTTNVPVYIGLGCISIGLICLILCKRKQDE